MSQPKSTRRSCEVCLDVESKYKCPQCCVKYCSVKCYKNHKANNCQIESSKRRLETGPVAVETERGIKECIGLHSEEEESEDTVPIERLQMLEHSPEVKVMLENPHLRAMLENLLNDEKTESNMAKAMMEPIFTEFADKCLEIVENVQS